MTPDIRQLASVPYVEEQIAAGTLDVAALSSALATDEYHGLVNYSANVGITSPARRMAEVLDRHFENDVPQPLRPTGNAARTYVSNLAFFAPHVFLQMVRDGSADLSDIVPPHAFRIAASQIAVEGLLEHLHSGGRVDTTAEMQLQLAFAVAAQNASAPVESERLAALLTLSTPDTLMGRQVRTWIQLRRSKLAAPSRRPAQSQEGKRIRVALMVCGQLRGFEAGLAGLADVLETAGVEIDAYVSAWDVVGGARITRTRASRRLTPEATEFVLSSLDDSQLEELDRAVPTDPRDGDVGALKRALDDCLGFARERHVHLASDREYPLSRLTGPSKMYYHNAYWINTLGPDYFCDQYDFIIKTRPDMRFAAGSRLGPAELSAVTSVAADTSGYIYEGWGFGMGDQFFYGPANTMVELLDLPFEGALSSQIMAEFEHRRTLKMGHVNLAVEHWLRGGRVEPSNVHRGGFHEVRKLTLEELQEFLPDTQEGEA